MGGDVQGFPPDPEAQYVYAGRRAVGNVQGRCQLDDRDVLGRQGPAEHVAAGLGCRTSRLAVSAAPKVRARQVRASNTPLGAERPALPPLVCGKRHLTWCWMRHRYATP